MARASLKDLKTAGSKRRSASDTLSFADLETDFVEAPTTVPAPVPVVTNERPMFVVNSNPKPNAKGNFIMDKTSDFYINEALDKRCELPTGVTNEKFAADLSAIREAAMQTHRTGAKPQNHLLDACIALAKREKRLAITAMKMLMRDITFRAHIDLVRIERKSTAGDAEIEAMRRLRDGAETVLEGEDGETGFDPTVHHDAPRIDHDAGQEGREQDEERPNDEYEIEHAVARIQAYLGQVSHALLPKERDRVYWGLDGEFPLMDRVDELPTGKVYTPVTDFTAARVLMEQQWKERDRMDAERLEKAGAFDALRA